MTLDTGSMGIDDPTTASLILAAGAGMVFALGWFPLRARLPHLQPLHPAKVLDNGPMIFVLGIFLVLVSGLVFGHWLGIDLEQGNSSLARILVAHSLANGVGVGLMMLATMRRPGGAESIGLAPHRGPSAWVVGPCAWLAYLPVLLVVVMVNEWMHAEYGWERQPQRVLQIFLDDDAGRGSAWVWLSIGLLNPVLEEIAFRGVLFGGLRRVFPAPMAIGFSAAIFASLHGTDPFLPVAALGVLLAWLYERTGSLKASCIVHGLHNVATLIMVTQDVPL